MGSGGDGKGLSRRLLRLRRLSNATHRRARQALLPPGRPPVLPDVPHQGVGRDATQLRGLSILSYSSPDEVSLWEASNGSLTSWSICLSSTTSLTRSYRLQCQLVHIIPSALRIILQPGLLSMWLRTPFPRLHGSPCTCMHM